MLFPILLAALYIYVGVCVGAGLFSKDDSLLALLVLFVACLFWPVTLLGMGVYKFTLFINRL